MTNQPEKRLPEPETSTRIYRVQLGFYRTRAEAQQAVDCLKQLGYPAYLVEPGEFFPPTGRAENENRA